MIQREEFGPGRVVWLRAGQDLLRAGGIGAVKIHALKEQTGLTTGSFYHHFSGMDDYLEALASFWGGDTPDHLVEAMANDPRERLRRLADIAPREELYRLDLAMRDWAGSNHTAAEAVRRVDEWLLRFLEQAFVDLGFDEADARFRAQLWLAAGVARISAPWPPVETFGEQLLDLLTEPRG